VRIEEEWTNLETILKRGQEIIGKVKRNLRKGWFDQECELVIVERKYQNMLQRKFITAAREEYNDMRKKE
jgi:hypothetical protein